MKKKLFITIIVLSISIFTLYTIGILPIVVNKTEIPEIETNNTMGSNALIKGSIINPIEQLNVINGTEVYLYIARDDLSDLPNEMSKYKVLYTNKIDLIKQLRDNFSFSYTGSDMATCESLICIRVNGKTVFQSNILLSNDLVGLQNQKYGWILSNQTNLILGIFKQFRPVYRPLVRL